MSGAIVHIEIPGGADTAQARAFWSALFGWQFEEVPVPSVEYSLARINNDQGVAVSSIEPDKRGIRPYFWVDDINASIIRIAELRGGLRKDVDPWIRLVRALPRPAREPVRAVAE